MNKTILINCGGHKGESVTWFKNNYDNDMNIVTFEPLINLNSFYKDFDNHTLINKAVWINNGIIDFYIGKANDGDGSTVCKEKKTGKLSNTPVKIPCVDFTEVLKEYKEYYDRIIVKFNIEGAEYKIIEHLINTNTLNLVDKFFVQWHWFKMNLTEEYHNNIIKEVKKQIDLYDLSGKYLSEPISTSKEKLFNYKD